MQKREVTLADGGTVVIEDLDRRSGELELAACKASYGCSEIRLVLQPDEAWRLAMILVNHARQSIPAAIGCCPVEALSPEPGTRDPEP